MLTLAHKRSRAQARSGVLDNVDIMANVLTHVLKAPVFHRDAEPFAGIPFLLGSCHVSRSWHRAMRMALDGLDSEAPWRALLRQWRLPFTRPALTPPRTSRQIFEQHLHARRQSPVARDPDASPHVLGIPPRVRSCDYLLGVEVHLISPSGEGLSGCTWHHRPITSRPGYLHAWRECNALLEEDEHGLHEDGLFWVCSEPLEADEYNQQSVWKHQEARGACERRACPLSAQPPSPQEPFWHSLKLSLSLLRQSDGKLLQLCVDQNDFKEDCFGFDDEEEDGVSTVNWFACFKVNHAIARFEVTFDLRDYHESAGPPLLNVAIDPREPHDGIHLIRSFSHLLRLAESHAASNQWV